MNYQSKPIISVVLVIVLLAFVNAQATIINVPGDQPNIQAGINTSTDGDTVLVQPGIYYENINFNGHNIVLASLFLTTGDTSYISQTVIDGDNYGTVITFENGEDSTAVVTGFTIRNGYSFQGSGIYCNYSNPIITYNTISENGLYVWLCNGGGVYCYYSNPIIYRNTIISNSTGLAYGDGGGIYLDHSNAIIDSNIIMNNQSLSIDEPYCGNGGGLYLKQSNAVISNNIIKNNHCLGEGTAGGLYCLQSIPILLNNIFKGNNGGACLSNSDASIINNVFFVNGAYGLANNNSNPIIINSIFWNFGNEIVVNSGNPAVTYSDIKGGFGGEGNIDADPLFIDPYCENFNVCLQSPCIDTGDPDITDPDGTRSDIGLFFPEHPACFTGNVWNVSTLGNDTTGNGSQENPFRTIQHAVDVSLHGDSVLVDNGMYIENIIIYYKEIVLASNHIYSNDFEDIETTILDGDSIGAVVNLAYTDSLSQIKGVTIQNGGSSGIYIRYANPVIKNNIIRDNYSHIYPNPYASGGGIFCIYSYPRIVNNLIVFNSADRGGGIDCFGSNPIIHNNTITGNTPHGIEYFSGFLPFNSPNISNCIVWGNAPNEIFVHGIHTLNVTYSDIRGGYEGEGNINIDPLFVNPDEYDFNLCAQSPCIDSGNPDMYDPDSTRIDMGFFFADHPVCDFAGDRWYVSVEGNDSLGDGTEDNPFRTIQYAVDMSSHNDTIVIENGSYIENIIVHAKNIRILSRYAFTYNNLDIENTVIDGDSNSTVITFESCDSNSELAGLTITNGYGINGGGIFINNSDVRISNNIIINNSGNHAGGVYDKPAGGICCILSSSIIKNNIIINNTADTWRGGGGIYTTLSSTTIINNVICFNNSLSVGGGIYLRESNPILINNVVCNNYSMYGGPGIDNFYSNPIIINSIIRDNSGPQLQIHVYGGNPLVYYSNINEFWPGEGNISIDPLFRDPANSDFHLMATYCGDSADSPCIDAGDPDILDSLLDCAWGLGTIRSDMGAYGGGDSAVVFVDDNKPKIPSVFSLSQNYPNPFNTQTVIRYSLPEPASVTLDIYNILGRHIETLIDAEQQAGNHQATWNAVDQPSGLYFYKIQAGEFSKTRKMVLLK